jgi:hypothetical protein
VVGYGWYRLWDSPPGVAFEGEWYPVPTDEGYRSIFGATATYVLLGAVAGLVLGILAALLARTSELVTLAAVVVGTAVAAWLSYRLGTSLGPPDPAAIAKTAQDFEEIPGNLAITGHSPFVAWTFGGLLGVTSTYLLTSGMAESRRRERQDPAWLTGNRSGHDDVPPGGGTDPTGPTAATASEETDPR